MTSTLLYTRARLFAAIRWLKYKWFGISFTFVFITLIAAMLITLSYAFRTSYEIRQQFNAVVQNAPAQIPIKNHSTTSNETVLPDITINK